MCRTADIADLPLASACDDPADHFLNAFCSRCNKVVDAACPDCGHAVEASGACENDNVGSESLRRSEFLRRFLQLLRSSRNAKFFTDCYYIATGDAYAEGLTMASYARFWSVRRATVSKQCKQICEALNIPPSRYMRDEETRAGFRLTNRRPRKV